MTRAMPDDDDLVARGAALIGDEAQLLDDARWDDWLSLYAEDCVFWVPAWRTDGELVSNPRREVSHIYIEGKGGLVDRITRIHSSLAASSIPLQRTARLLGRSTIAEKTAEALVLRTSWISNVYFPRQRKVESFFGHYEHSLAMAGDALAIQRKKIVIKNDFVRTMLDFYFV